MTEPRRAVPADRGALLALWQEAFGDSEDYIRGFFMRFPPEKTAWVVEENGAPCTAAYLLESGRLGETPCAYVYAVATRAASRGRGYAGRLMRRFTGLAEARGALLYTRPAEPGLFAWYHETLGTAEISFLREERILRAEGAAQLPAQRVGAAEYARLREARLAGTAHIALSPALLAQFEADGALLAVGGGCAAVEATDGTLAVRELLVPAPQTEDAVQTLLRYYSCKLALLRRPAAADAGVPAVAWRAVPGLTEEINWGLLLD